jgi:hypothetical protein
MKKICLAASLGLALAAFVAAFAHADNVGLNLHVGSADAHIDLGPAHPHDHPYPHEHATHLSRAAQACRLAKNILWNSPRRGRDMDRAIYLLNHTLDQLRWFENHPMDRHRGAAIFQAKRDLARAERLLWPGHRRSRAKADALVYMDQARKELDLIGRP